MAPPLPLVRRPGNIGYVHAMKYGQGSHFALFVIDKVLKNIRVYDSDLNFGTYDNHVVTRLREAFECMEFPVFFFCSYAQEDYSNGSSNWFNT